MSKNENEDKIGIIKNSFNFVTQKILEYVESIKLSNTINYYSIDKNSIALDNIGKLNLYGISFKNKTNELKTIDDFDSLTKEYSAYKNAKLFLFFINKNENKNILIFSTEKKIIETISGQYDLDMLNSNEIVNGLLEIFLLGKKNIIDNKVINTLDITNFDEDIKIDEGLKKITFNKRISNAANSIIKEYKIYQAISSKENQFDPIDFFRNGEWEGVVQIMLDLSTSSLEHFIKRVKYASELGDAITNKATAALLKNKDALHEYLNTRVIAQAIMYLNNPNQKTKIENQIGLNFEENLNTGTKLLANTLIMKRDFHLYFPIKKEYCQNLLKSSLAKPNNIPLKKKVPDTWGMDINGNLINISYGDNNKPHAAIIGDTGVGKSVSVGKTVKNIIGLTENKVKYIDDIRLRFCDVGWTNSKSFLKMQMLEPEKTEILESSISTFKFNLLDFDLENNILDNEIKFAISLMNIILAAKDTENEKSLSFTPLEEDALYRAILKVVNEKKTIKTSLYELINERGYKDVVNKLLEMGYSLETNNTEIKEKEYDFLRKPIVQNLIEEIEDIYHSPNISETDKLLHAELLQKVKAIQSYKTFSYFSNFNFHLNKNIYYIDFSEIKESSLEDFIGIFWMLFKKWMTIDKKINEERTALGLDKIQCYYFIEEAHNFTKIKKFNDLFTVATRETRKYDIYLIFITQYISDLPVNVWNALGTRTILFSGPDKEKVLKQLKKQEEKIDPNSIYLFEKIKNTANERYMFVYNESGSYAIKYLFEEEELEMYKPYSLNAKNSIEEKKERKGKEL